MSTVKCNGCMTLGELLQAFATPDHENGKAKLSTPVVFDTFNRSDLTVLSVYFHKGKIHVDVGTEDEA